MTYRYKLGRRRSWWYSRSLGFDTRWLLAGVAMFAISILAALAFAESPL